MAGAAGDEHGNERSDERVLRHPPQRVFLQIVPRLSGAGFKILLDIAASAPRRLRVAEVPYTFRLRLAGESKLGASGRVRLPRA